MSFSALPALAEDACTEADAGGGSPGNAESGCVQSVSTRGAITINLNFRHAGLRPVRVAWECVGPVDAPLLVVQGGISATRHVASNRAHAECGWWEAQAAAGCALDSARHRLFSIDWLGADGSFDAPIDPADQADAIAAVLDTLRLGRVNAFVGASYGAMVGLQFALRHGSRLDRLIAISGAHRSHAQATALRVIQRRIVALGRGQAALREALALARSLAVVGYRSAAEFDDRFAQAPEVAGGNVRFAVEDYFDTVGPRFVARFTPTAYLRLSESIDLQQLDPTQLRVPLDLVAVAQDQVVPLGDLEALASATGARCRLHRIDSQYGHDAFLKEVAAIDAVLRTALQSEVAA
jgi:homoserine O-acetyltransferase